MADGEGGITMLCSCGCGQPRDRPGQRYRRECKAAYDRSWRKKVRDKTRRAIELLEAAGWGKDVSRETAELLKNHGRGKE